MLKEFENLQNKHIFCYLRGKHHFDLFLPIFSHNTNINFYVHSNGINVDEFRKSKLYNLPNVVFTSDIQEIKYKLNLFGIFITTDAQSSHAHSYSLKLISLFKHLSIPVIELQHGLFQLGLHYYDCPLKDTIHPDSLPTKSFADHILTYYPINNYKNISTIGYPPYFENVTECRGEYGLILSNMHWDAYSIEEKYLFYKTVLQFVEKSENIFIWKMHHGEINNKVAQNMLNNMFLIFPEAQEKIVFYHKNDMLQYSTLPDLIRKSNFVISTVSTVLLDCEICHKNTYVFECASNKCLTQKLKNVPLFSNYEELKECCDVPSNFKTGLLHRYNNNIFLDCINKLYHQNLSYDKKMLENILGFK